ncbi:MAG: EamA family transporter [Acidobacteria bacterium]|nr:EamA family transporter [Acidobacteriota bacterium]
MSLAPGAKGAAAARAYAAWLVVCVVWGTTYLAIRISIETYPPLLMSAVRWLTAGSLLVAILVSRGQRLPGRATWPGLAMLGLLLIGFGNGAVVWAEQTVPSGLTAVLVAVAPFWMVAIEALVPGGAPLTPRSAGGLLVGFAGIVVLVWPDLQVGGPPGFTGGVIATQLACLGWALGSVYSKRRGPGEHVLAAVSIEMLFGGLWLLAGGLLHREWSMAAYSLRSTLGVLYLVAFGSIVGFSAYTYALGHLPVATVSLYAYVNPLIAVALGTAVLHEPVSARMLAAAAIVLAGMAIVRGKR